MRPASATLTNALHRSHMTCPLAEVIDASGAVVASSDPDTDDVVRLPLLPAGEVVADETAAVLRRSSITLTDRLGQLAPSTAVDLLAPGTNEIRLSDGAVTRAGKERVTLGTFSYDDVDVDDTGNGLTIKLTGQDRAAKVAGRFAAPWIVAPGTLYTDAIRDVIAARLGPLATFAVAPAPYTTPLLIFEEKQDPWKDAVAKMSTAIGYWVYFDPDGTCHIEPRPSGTGMPVWEFLEDEFAGALDLSAQWKANEYDSVIVTGEGVEPPVRRTAGSAATLRPYFVTSKFVTTGEQAQAYADATWDAIRGSSLSVEFSALPNPLLEAGLDVADVSRARARISGAWMLSRTSYRLGGLQPMRITTRERRVA